MSYAENTIFPVANHPLIQRWALINMLGYFMRPNHRFFYDTIIGFFCGIEFHSCLVKGKMIGLYVTFLIQNCFVRTFEKALQSFFWV